MKWVFFGSPDFSAHALSILKERGLVPDLIITAPDRPAGRGLVLTPSPVKIWAEHNGVEVLAPEKLKDESVRSRLEQTKWDFFLVFAYGKILRDWLLNMPTCGTLNIHPSLLPKFRGSSPITSFILSNETETGVTIMKIDEEVDHGPILSQEVIPLDSFRCLKFD